MRTALILLFLLAIAAVPGSLLPQRPLNPTKTASWIASHGAWGTFLNRIGMFDVFGSPWFAAIYLLLFISLVGCLDPAHPRARPGDAGQVRCPPPSAWTGCPNLAELPDLVLARRSSPTRPGPQLGRRWRVESDASEDHSIVLSAEKGYSRETGNLVFHVALLVALIAIAVGQSLQATRVRACCARARTPSATSSVSTTRPRLGRFAQDGKVSPAPFCMTLNQFTAAYNASG